MSPVILGVNAGSSSLKFALHPLQADGQAARACLSGLAEGLEPGGQPRVRWGGPGLDSVQRELQPLDDESPFDSALRAVIGALAHGRPRRLLAVAHRVVHGGTRYRASVRVDDAVLAELRQLQPLAPLHQPHNLAGIEACRRAFVDVPQVACFDTAFHADAPELEQRLALPDSLWQQGVRRYGFHGLSYAFVSRELAGRSAAARGRLLLAHLGNGASLCAVRNLRAVASTMGFSALDGLMMGTRCGALDPGVLLHLLDQGWDRARIEDLLYRRSGLLGVSGLSADVRTLRQSDSADAQRALQMFSYRVIRESGALVACMGGVDAIGFTGGIGEHDATLRREVATGLAHLGVELDEGANQAATGDEPRAIHVPRSRVEVWVVPTDESRVAASDAARLLQLARQTRGVAA